MGRRGYGIYVYRGMSVFVCTATALPLFRGEHWLLRLFDYPRMQVFSLGMLLLGAGLWRAKRWRHLDRFLLGTVLTAAVVQAVQIYPYTPMADETVLRVDGDADLRLLTSNVLQDNRQSGKLLELIRQVKPNMVLLTETDQWWVDQMKPLEKEFPYVVKKPLTNYYGMVLYSKLKLIDPKVRYVVKEEIPSIVAQVEIPGKGRINFYGVHPEPPGSAKPSGGLRGTGPRDAELVVVAKEVQQRGGPTLVAGDFNDVAWSHTTRLFKRIAELLDPRVGRGFFNTFHAKYPFLRYPLDHFFHSQEFGLVELKRLPEIGSDHFPIYLSLKLTPKAEAAQEPPRPKPGDEEEAREIVKEAPRE